MGIDVSGGEATWWMLMMSHSRGSICLVPLASPYDKDHVESILNVQMHHEKCHDGINEALIMIHGVDTLRRMSCRCITYEIQR